MRRLDGMCVPACFLLVLLVLLPDTACLGTELKVATEYRYPTAFQVVLGQVVVGPGGGMIMTEPFVVPTDFETREVGVVMSATVLIGPIGGVAAVVNGSEIINGNTPLMISATLGDSRKVNSLLAKGSAVDARNKFGSTALMGAAAGGYEDIVKILIGKKAEVGVQSLNGFTPLMFAAKNGHEGVVRMLLEQGADVNVADGEGFTALMHAAAGGHAEVIELLAAKGADVNRRSPEGLTALKLARTRDEGDIVVLLTKLGAKE